MSPRPLTEAHPLATTRDCIHAAISKHGAKLTSEQSNALFHALRRYDRRDWDAVIVRFLQVNKLESK